MDGDHDGSELQEEQLLNGDVDVPAADIKAGGDCSSSNSQDMEVTGADGVDRCDKKAFSDAMSKHVEVEGLGEKMNGLVNGDGGDDDSDGDMSGSKEDMDTSEKPIVKDVKEVTGMRSEEKDSCSEEKKSEKNSGSEMRPCSEETKSVKEQCSEENNSDKDHCDQKLKSDEADVSMKTDADVGEDGKGVEENSEKEMDESAGKKDKKEKPETISDEVHETKDSKNVSAIDKVPENSRKRKSLEDNVISSDDEVHEEIVIQKKPKLRKTEKSVVVATSVAPVAVTYSVGQSLCILPNQPGTVRMVIPTMHNKLITQGGQSVIISPNQSSIFTTQGVTLGAAVLYPPLQAGVNAGGVATFAQGGKTFKARMPFVNKAGNRIAVTNVTSSKNQILEMKSPADSFEMMELVKWEMKQGMYNRPKSFKLKPDSELGPMARVLRDFGQDLVKESVYSDLVRIQSRRGNQGKLSDKEKKDFEKLKTVHGELKDKVGPVMIHLKKKCTCGFKTESDNVMHWHKQFPHIDEYDMNCAYCDFDTRTSSVFVFHMEVEHKSSGKFVEKPPFWECSLCPYETNVKTKLTQHRMRCAKTFKLSLNLHPSWLPGPEINYCLEKIFYKNPVLMSMVKQQARPNIMPKQNAGVIANKSLMGRFPVHANQSNRNPHLLASLNKKVQNTPRMQYQGRMGFPNVNMFHNKLPLVGQKTGNLTYVRPTATNTVSNKINSIISMNNRVLDNKSGVPQTKPNSGFEVCEICGGYVKDRTALRIHFFYAHRIDMPHGVFDRVHPPLYCATCFARFWTAQGLQKHLDVHKEDASGGVAGKCIVCLHRVPNILMHMKIVHNKAFVNFLRDCKCIFCGTKFHSKVLVEGHMASVHGVVVKSGGQPSPSAANQAKKQLAGATPKSPKGRKDNLVKGSVCVLCNLNFGRNVDLTRHCMRVHHTCMKCGMVVADKESLLKHTCLESPSGLRNCELCGEKGFHPAYHVKHIRDKHLRKLSVRVNRLDKSTVAKFRRRPGPRRRYQQAAVDPIELSDDDEPCTKQRKVESADGDAQKPLPTATRRKGPLRRGPREPDVVLLIDDSDEEVKKDDEKNKSDDHVKKGEESSSAKTGGDVEKGAASTSDEKDEEKSKESDSKQDRVDDSAGKDGVKKDIDKGRDDGNKKVASGDETGDKGNSDKEVASGDKTDDAGDKGSDDGDKKVASRDKTDDKDNDDSGDTESTDKK